MASFEQLLSGDENELAIMFARFRAEPSGDPERQLANISQGLGLNTSQLICGFGFNVNAIHLPRALNALGFSSYDALWGQRNYTFINDVYRMLSIDNVISIYLEVGSDLDAHDFIPDLVLSRLNSIESQIEATINPVMLGSYKLEIRAVYENHVVAPDLVDTRLEPQYEVLRGIVDEVILIVESGTLTPDDVLSRPGVSADEKRKLLFRGLVDRDQISARLQAPDISELERKLLSQALENE